MAEKQNPSAIDSPTGRLVSRLTDLSARRPLPAQDFRADATTRTLRWTHPKDSRFTHWRLRIDHDDGEPDFELNEGTSVFQLSYGSQFALAAYNRANGMESSLVYVNYDVPGTGTGGGSGDCSCGSGFTHVLNQTFTANAAVPDTSFTPCTGDTLTWSLIFNASGPWTVTGWGAQYKNAPTTAIDGSPSTLTQVRFVGRADGGGTPRWYYDGHVTALTDL